MCLSNNQVGDISGSFRWAPFLALQTSNSFLTMLLLLSKYRMKSVPVVNLGEVKIDNIITQSAVIHMLEECAGLHWFESWGSKKLSELGLPLMKSNRIVKVNGTRLSFYDIDYKSSHTRYTDFLMYINLKMGMNVSAFWFSNLDFSLFLYANLFIQFLCSLFPLEFPVFI